MLYRVFKWIKTDAQHGSSIALLGFLRIWSSLLKKSLIEDFIFLCSVEHVSTAKTSNQSTSICHKTKKEIQSVSAYEYLVYRYKGFSNLPMPAKEAAYNLLPLHVLVRAAFSMDKSSHRRCSIKKCVLRNFVKFTGKHLC